MAKLNDFPAEGELIVGTVASVQNFGAFVNLEEYPGKQGFVHIREIASGWVKRIRDHVREQQRVVCKVQGIDEKRGHIDLSLKSVNDHQRRDAIQAWKNEQKADKLVEMYCAEHGIEAAQFHADISTALLGTWESLYDAFQEISEFGADVLTEVGVTADWVEPLIKFCRQNIQASFVEIVGFLELRSYKPNGVKDVAAALTLAEESEFDDVTIACSYKGAPFYRMEVKAPDFKIAEDQMKKSGERAIEAIEKSGGMGSFHREVEE